MLIDFEDGRAVCFDGEKEAGECTFRNDDGIWIADHTFVDPGYAGQGIAKKLLQCVVDNAVKNDAKIKPVCSYVAHEFEKNPQLYCDVKAYAFYGWKSASVPAIEPEFKSIKNPRHLYDLLLKVWCADTCAPRMRDNWSKDNPTLGQCSITSFLVQDIFGGEVRGILRAGGNFHCYNVVNGCVFDLTSEQFGDEKLNYENNPLQSGEVHFAKEEKRLRYEYLKKELLAIL